MQLSDLRWQEQLLLQALFAVDMEMDGVQRRMEQSQVMEQLSNMHVAYIYPNDHGHRRLDALDPSSWGSS